MPSFKIEMKTKKNKPNLLTSRTFFAILLSSSDERCLCFIIQKIIVVNKIAPIKIVIPPKICSALPVKPPARLINNNAPIRLAIKPAVIPA